MAGSVVNLFVIGASKCGTTYLHGLLDRHPDIQMCPTKEPRFFQDADCMAHLNDYEALFSSLAPAQYYGESSPSYSETTFYPTVVENLHRYNPDARLVYLVREPLSRLGSVWVQAQSTGHWSNADDYGRKMPLDYFRAISEYPPFLEATRYWTHLSNYLSRFGDGQVHVIFFEDLVADPAGVLDSLFRFLGLEPADVLSGSAPQQNEGAGKTMYSPVRSRLASVVPRSVHNLVPGVVRRAVGTTIARVFDQPLVQGELTQEQALWVRRELAAEVGRLYEHLGVTHDPWGFAPLLDR